MTILKWPSAGKYDPSKGTISKVRKAQIEMVNQHLFERLHLKAHAPVMELAEQICQGWRDSHPERVAEVSYAYARCTHQSVCADLHLGEEDHISSVFDCKCCDPVLEDVAWEYYATYKPNEWQSALAWVFKNYTQAIEDTSNTRYWDKRAQIVPSLIIRIWFNKSKHCEMKGTGKFEEIKQLCCS